MKLDLLIIRRKTMINTTVTIRQEGRHDRFIKMSMGEYVSFIKEQSKLLNIKEENKLLTRNIERTHPGLKDPYPYKDPRPHPTNENKPNNKNQHIAVNLKDNGLTTEELAKKLNEILNQKSTVGASVMATKPNLPPKKNTKRSDR